MIARLKRLEEKHAALEEQLHQEQTRAWRDDSIIRNLKKTKLQIRDEILKMLPNRLPLIAA
jgi:hypothetical protein